MKQLVCCIILLLAVRLAFGQDVRKATWGMTIEKVKQTEKLQPVAQQPKTLLYQDKIAGSDCLISYMFSSKGLSVAALSFQREHSNLNDFILDFEKIKKLLFTKYGETVTDEVVWKNDLYKDNAEDWGMAISVGHLYYRAKWKNARTEIVLALFGENYEVRLDSYYYSNDYYKTYETESSAADTEGM